jgi:hypothetical protein
VLARRGEFELAERHARDAVALAERTDFLSLHGDAVSGLAEVLRLAARADESVSAAEEALALYERKGNRISAAAMRSALAATSAAPA